MLSRWIIRLSFLLTALSTLSACGYNDIQGADETTKSAWSEVLNQYQRRADLIPNLVNTVKGFADQEKEVFIRVTEARSKVGQIQVNPSDPESLKKFEQAQGEVGSALSRLLVVSENYPQLKSDANFRDLQAQLEGTENRITVERQKFNDDVQDFNTYIRKFPQVMLAGMYGFKDKAFFAADKGAEKAPKVEF